MSLRELPHLNIPHALQSNITFDIRPEALAHWSPMAEASTAAGSISILDVIGYDWEGNGVTAQRISAALRSVGRRDVVVQINSPGGDFFEGIAIYNLLRNHPAKVTVQVIGLAASAASVIAMAGDAVQMGTGSFLMIHNAWAVGVGNRHQLQAISESLAPYDAAMAKLYAQRTGMPETEIATLMDKETFLNASDAIERRFADGSIGSDTQAMAFTHAASVQSERKALISAHAALSRAGYSASRHQEMITQFFPGTPRAAGKAARPYAEDASNLQLQRLITTLTN